MSDRIIKDLMAILADVLAEIIEFVGFLVPYSNNKSSDGR